MNYQIIIDENIFKDFIDWLPELEPNETYYGCLFARKKYCQELVHSSDKTQLKRFTGNKSNLYWKVKQLECELGSYRLKDRNVPQDALALYIQPNPRDLVKASWAGIRELADALQSKSQGFNPQQEVMSCIQRAKGRKFWVDFDLDSKDANLLKLNEIFCDFNRYHKILETRGGYHILINPQKATEINIESKKFPINWYSTMKAIFNVDQVGDQLMPVPGCTQGGFSPHFITL